MTKNNMMRTCGYLGVPFAVALAAAIFVAPARGDTNPAAARGGAAVGREEVFQFTQAPTFRKLTADRYEVRFASQAACDVTVGIEDATGRVVRHLASGVLGPNAPEPLKPNSLEQTLVWDGKNDLGRYVENPAACRARVGLGLTPTLDKVLYWHANRFPMNVYGLAADADGVYVFTTEGNPTQTTAHQPPDLSHIQVYDHQGNYLRTILPLPAGKVTPDKYVRSNMHGQPAAGAGEPKAGSDLPMRFVLPDGKSVITPNQNGQYFKFLEANAFGVDNGVLTGVVYPGPHDDTLSFFRLKTDGSMPDGGFYTAACGKRGGTGPLWMARSPDGKWLYLSAIAGRERDWHSMNWGWSVRGRKEAATHAVYRLPADFSGPLQPFVGEENTDGNDEKHLRFPEGVSVDASGKVFVCDTGNDRVAVFDETGKFQTAIPVPSPYQAVHGADGTIYVLSYPVKLRKMTLLKFPPGKSAPTAQLELPAENLGTRLLPSLTLDRWAKVPTVWLVDGNFRVVAYEDKGDKFVLLRDLHDDYMKGWHAKSVEDQEMSGFSSVFFAGNLAADPIRPYLYLGDCRGGGPIMRFGMSPRINTDTGEIDVAPGATRFGYDGLAYVRDGQKIYRFDPSAPGARSDGSSGPKKVAFDYGSGADGVLEYQFCSEDGIGFGVSPQGGIIYHDRWPPVPGLVIDIHVMELNQMRIPAYMRDKRWSYGKETSLRGYPMRQLFPGGMYRGAGALLVYDAQGQMRNTDAVGGLPRVSSGVQMDVQGNIYVGMPVAKMLDGQPLAGYSLVKFRPTGGRLIVNGPGVPVPLTDVPKRAPDVKPMFGVVPGHDDKGLHGEVGYGDKGWLEGACWSYGGYFPFNHTKCVCLNGRFDLDYWGRSFVPESFRNSLAVLDTNGNFILRLGRYGNCDDRGPEIATSHVRYVAVTDRKCFLNDVGNKRILSLDLKYAAEKVAELTGPTSIPSTRELPR